MPQDIFDKVAASPKEDIFDKVAAQTPPMPRPQFPLQPQPVPASARFAGGLGEGLEGLLSPVLHPLDTARSLATELDPGTPTRRVVEALQNPEHRSVGGVLAAALPIVGPTVQKLADQYRSGDTAGVAGNLAAMGLAGLAPEAPSVGDVINAGAKGVAERLYGSALKAAPRSNTFNEVNQMIRTGIDEGVPVNERGLMKQRSIVSDLKNQAKGEIAANPTAPISPGSVAERTNPTIADFERRDLQKDLAAAQTEKARFLNEHSTPISYSPFPPAHEPSLSFPADVNTYQREVPIPAERAQAMKEGIWNELAEPDFGQKSSGYKETRKQLGRGLKEELEGIFPNIKGINARMGKVIDLGPDLEAAVNRNRNKEVLGLGTPIATGAIGAATGSIPAAIVGGTVRSLMDMPGIKSRLAIALDRLATNR